MIKNDLFVLKWNNNFFECSENFENLTGFSKSEIENLPFKHHSIVADEVGSQIHNEVIEHFKHSSDKKIFDIELSDKNGRNIWFREYISLSDEDILESILFDISEFKRNEIHLNEIIDEKIKLNSSKDKLISIISHDLRAPFSSLLGFSEILLNESNLPETEKKEYLQYIYDASKIQLQMVNHLLDWTRLKTGKIKFNPQRLDIKDIIDNCVSVLTGSVIRKELKINVKADRGLFVNADERLLSQAVTNLLSNAVKFTPPGKEINVTTGLFKDNMIEVIIADEGVGIDEQHHDKIFRIDSKFSKTGTDGEKGSGFGLALVKEIIEKHKGNIWFYSELNKGSEFHLTLPRSEDKILIVEEHPDLQNPYQNLINEKYNHLSLSFSKNGIEALNSILKNIPSILITYHEMPLMNGIKLVSSLREKDIHNKTSVIILCDNLSEKEKAEYSSYGVMDFLPVNSSIDEIDITLSKIQA